MDQRTPIQLKITAKGQVTLRKELLQHLGVRPGDRISVVTQGDGKLTVERTGKQGRWADLAGILHVPGQKALTIEEINEIIAKGWAGEL